MCLLEPQAEFEQHMRARLNHLQSKLGTLHCQQFNCPIVKNGCLSILQGFSASNATKPCKVPASTPVACIASNGQLAHARGNAACSEFVRLSSPAMLIVQADLVQVAGLSEVHGWIWLLALFSASKMQDRDV